MGTWPMNGILRAFIFLDIGVNSLVKMMWRSAVGTPSGERMTSEGKLPENAEVRVRLQLVAYCLRLFCTVIYGIFILN